MAHASTGRVARGFHSWGRAVDAHLLRGSGKFSQVVSLAPLLADASLTAQGHWWPSATAACPACPGVASTGLGRVSHGHHPGADEGRPGPPLRGVAPGGNGLTLLA